MKKLFTIESKAKTVKGVHKAIVKETGDPQGWPVESVWEGLTDGTITADGKHITVYKL